LKLKRLAEEEVVKSQQRGYFDEHLATLYSTAYGQPYLYEDKYLLYADSTTRDVSLTLFRLDEESGSNEERLACIKELTAHLRPHKLTITSPSKLPSRINDFVCRKEYNDKDYQIDLKQFDESLLGRSYKNLRYHVNHAKRCGYVLEVGKTLTSSHINIIAHFLEKSRNYESWDLALYLGLSEYVSKFASPRLFNVFSNGILIGFDVIDALSDVKDKVLDRISIIEVLDRNRSIWVRVMEDLSRRVPDYLWLSLLKEEQSPAQAVVDTTADSTVAVAPTGPEIKRVTLEGYSHYLNSLASFLIRLMGSPYFDNMELQYVKRTELKEYKTFSFQLVGDLRYLSEFESPDADSAVHELSLTHKGEDSAVNLAVGRE